MKALIAALAMTLVSSISAAAPYDYFSCKEMVEGRPAKQVFFTLRLLGTKPHREGQKSRYALEIRQRGEVKPLFAGVAIAESEDVNFTFEVKGKGISGQIYLDEYDQTSLTIGRKNFRLTCE